MKVLMSWKKTAPLFIELVHANVVYLKDVCEFQLKSNLVKRTRPPKKFRAQRQLKKKKKHQPSEDGMSAQASTPRPPSDDEMLASDREPEQPHDEDDNDTVVSPAKCGSLASSSASSPCTPAPIHSCTPVSVKKRLMSDYFKRTNA